MVEQDNQPLTILSLTLGYTQTVMWIMAMIFYTFVPVKVCSSNGLSYDFIGQNVTGFFLLGLQDCYGSWNYSASYHNGVHIPDQIISAFGQLYGAANLVSLSILPRTSPKNFTWVLGKIPIICMILTVILVYSITGNLDVTMITCGIVKGIQSCIAYIPQIYNNYSNKSTFGFSQSGIFCDCGGGSIALIQIVVDYQRVSQNTSFFKTLNYGKFFLNFFSVLMTVILQIQNYCIYGAKEVTKPKNNKKVSTNIEEEKEYTFPTRESFSNLNINPN